MGWKLWKRERKSTDTTANCKRWGILLVRGEEEVELGDFGRIFL